MIFLARYGSAAVFAAMFLEQAGLPIPAVPVLLGAGALIASHQLNAVAVLGLAIIGGLLGDWIWYELGRHYGARVLGTLCHISIEPETCVRRTENTFVRHGVNTLLAAKFLPGFSLVAPPLAGVFNITRKRFILYDAAGAGIYCLTFLLLGAIFRTQIVTLLNHLAQLGKGAAWVVGGGLAVYILFKVLQRQWYIRQLQVARITPEALAGKIAAGEKPLIFDVRSDLELTTFPYVVPGAIHMPPESFGERHTEIPRDREVIVYCSCPSEITSGHFAMRLRRRGIKHIRLLLGGINAWRYYQYDFEPVKKG